MRQAVVVQPEPERRIGDRAPPTGLAVVAFIREAERDALTHQLIGAARARVRTRAEAVQVDVAVD